MPVKVLVILIAWLALILNFVASVVDQSGKHSHHAIQVLSFVVVGLEILGTVRKMSPECASTLYSQR